jgi:hypothetical protein
MTKSKQYLHKKTRGLTTPPSLEVCATTTDARNATASEKLQCFLRQLAPLTTLCCISTLEMPHCEMKELNTESLAGVVTQCPALALLNIRKGADRSAESESLARVLGQCTVLGGSKFVRRRPNFETESLRASSHKRAL